MEKKTMNPIWDYQSFFRLTFSKIFKIILPSFFVLIFIVPNIASAQKTGERLTVAGKITNAADTVPIAGVSVAIKGTTKGVVTNNDGQFTINVLKGQTLVISDVSHTKQEITINNDAPLNIALQPLQQSLTDVVVIGYGTQKRANITGAISTVDVAKTFGSRPLNDPTKALQGAAPGLSISYNNGGLTAQANIKIRGVNTFAGSSNPLILVDNVETDDLSVINPDDIEKVSILKDVASTSIYGARAAFGVILIKTKTGNKNRKTTVKYSNNFYWGQPTVLPDFADPSIELPAISAADKRAGLTPELFGMNLDTLAKRIDYWKQNYASNRKGLEMVPGEDFDISSNSAPYFYRIWDVKKIMLRAQPGQQHNMSISGGSEKIGYTLSGGYSNDGGIFKMNPDNVKKYNIAAAVSATVTNWWDVDVKMLYRNFEYDFPFQYQDYFYYMWRWGSYWPYGTYQGKYFRNVPAYLNAAQTNTVTDNYSRVDLGSTIKLTPKLNVRVTYSLVKDNALGHQIGGPVMAWNSWTIGAPLSDISNGVSQNIVGNTEARSNINVFNTTATYENTFKGTHHLTVVGGINAQDQENIYFQAQRQGLLDPLHAEIPLATGTQFANGSHNHNAFAGYFGRISYDYKDKYLFQLNGVYDGSSSYAAPYRWSFISSGSIGYRISKEKFMDFIKPVITDWKIRGSYGANHNQDFLNIGGYPYLPLMGVSQISWMSGGNYVQGTSAPNAVAQSLKWEYIKELNLGTDISLLNDRLTISFDWYDRKTTGMLTKPVVPASFGTAGPWLNDGSMQTRGWEISIGGTWPVNKDLALYGTLTATDYKSKITKWNNPAKLLSSNYAGQTLGDIWGFETDRYFTANDFVKDANGKPTTKFAQGVADQTALTSGTFAYGPGDIKYKDLDGNDTISGGKFSANDHGDLRVIGNSMPRYQIGFRLGASYKNFDIDAFFQGVGKQNLWGTGNFVLPMYQGGDILYAHQLDFWTPTHTNARYPNPYPGNGSGTIPGLSSGGNNFYPQTKYLLNLAYLRLKNLNIGYTLPHDLLGKYGIQSVRFYASAENLFTISNVGVPIDPEATYGPTNNATGRTYPIEKMYSFGVQIKFQ